MSLEKRWEAIPAKLLTANGTSLGVLTVSDVRPFKVKQDIILSSNTQDPKILQVKRVPSLTTIEVGLSSENINQRQDVSMFLVADGASIKANEQVRPKIGKEDYDRAEYAEEPIVARRSIMVDERGNYYNDDNPFPTSASIAVDSLTVTVALDAFTKVPADNAISVGTEDGTKTGIKHALKIGSDGKAEVKDTAADASLAAIDSKLGSPLPLMAGAATAAKQDTGNASLTDIDSSTASIDAKLSSPLPLPTGAATAAKQDVGNSSLSDIDASTASIDSKLNTLGQKNKAGSVPVTLATDQDPVRTIQLFTKPFDAITATYPSTTQEVFASRVGGVSGTVQETVTINYTDTSKNFIFNVART